MADHETPLQRHVLEGEERIARQRAIVENIERNHYPDAALARHLLETMEETLRIAHQHRDDLAEKDRP